MRTKSLKIFVVSLLLFSLSLSQIGISAFFIFPRTESANAGVIPENQGEITLKKGWNLISPSDERLSSEYLMGCEIASGPWEWDPINFEYKKSSTLKPLNAYWVRVDEDCTLQVGSDGAAERNEKSSSLKAGWNLIASTSNYNWDQIKGSCSLSVSWLFDASGSDYGMLSPYANLEPFRGYWVKVESACTITEPVTTFSVEDLFSIDNSFYCYFSQGTPENSCDSARVIEKGGTEYCRYYGDISCQKNSSGYYEWICGTATESPRPGSDYECTEEGWKKIPDSESDKDGLRLDLCNITSSMLSNLLGGFAQEFTGEVIVGLFGEDLAKKIQGLVDFYFWLEAKGIDPVALAQNPDPDVLAEHLRDFIDLGVGALKDVAANAIKNFIVEFSAELKLNAGVAQELGNFASYLVENGQNLSSLSSNTAISNFLLNYAKENSSPLIKKMLRAEKIINLIKAGLDIESEASRSQILQAINNISSNVLDKIKDDTDLSDDEINTIVRFVRYMVSNQNLSLKEILEKTKAELESSWQSYAQSNGITLQRGIDIIKSASYDLAAEAANELLDIVEIDVEIDGEMVQEAIDNRLIEKSIQFIKYLLFDKNYSFSEIAVQIEGDGFSVLLDQSGLEVDVDSQVFLEKAVKYLTDTALGVLEENFNLNTETIKYGIDFLNYVINAEGKDIVSLLDSNVSSFLGSFEGYINSRGRTILTQIVVDFVKPYIQESLGISPELLTEAARFAKFLSQSKNVSLEEIASYSSDRIEELLIEFSAKAGEQLTGIRYDVLHRLFKIVVNQNLVQDIVHLDFKSIIQKLLIRVEINGNFACPTDLASAVCTLLDGNNWEDCSTGQLPVVSDSSSSHNMKLYDPNNIKPASIGICTVPNIYISILGEPIITGINIKVGPIAYRGTKLRLDMPTTNKINWGDGTDKDSLYKAKRNDGLYHQYSSGGNYNLEAKCRFILNIDLLGFHWPTTSQKVNKSIYVP